jgi:hypothetical protein
MVNPTHRNTTGATSRNAAAALDRSSDTLSSPRISIINSSTIDDVIGSLANAYENKRARQVVEWERLWRQKLSDNSVRAVL